MGKKRTDFNDFPDMIREFAYEQEKEAYVKHKTRSFGFRCFKKLLEKLRKKGGKNGKN